MPRVIFHVEGRGSDFIFHWFMYMIAGFRYLHKKAARIGPRGGGTGFFEKNYNLHKDEEVNKPYMFFISSVENLLKFQVETLEIIQNEYKFISKQEIFDDDIVINNYGEYIQPNGHIPDEGMDFLRNLFLKKLHINTESVHKDKSYFLCRSRSHILPGNNGLKRRHILNEDKLIHALRQFNIEPIYLEDFPIKEKIEIFNQSKLIIGPNTGGFVFLLFANPKIKILEINIKDPHQISDQYQNICRWLNCKYEKFYADTIDHMDNMIVDIDDFLKSFEKFLKN